MREEGVVVEHHSFQSSLKSSRKLSEKSCVTARLAALEETKG